MIPKAATSINCEGQKDVDWEPKVSLEDGLEERRYFQSQPDLLLP